MSLNSSLTRQCAQDLVLYNALNLREQMWHVLWLHGATALWSTGDAQMKHTSASTSSSASALGSPALRSTAPLTGWSLGTSGANCDNDGDSCEAEDCPPESWPRPRVARPLFPDLAPLPPRSVWPSRLSPLLVCWWPAPRPLPGRDRGGVELGAV